MATMTRSEAWADSYIKNRYMAVCTDEEFRQRFIAAITASMVLTESGKVGVSNDKADIIFASEILQHHFIEARIRGVLYSMNPLDYESTIFGSFKSNKAKISRICGARYPRGDLFKYGRKEFLSELIASGTLRISAASYYEKLSNPALQDNEMQREFVFHDGNTDFTGGIGTIKNPILRAQFRSTSDFYISCYAHKPTSRLFLDVLDYDACLVIKNITKFESRFRRSVRAQLGPDYNVISRKVKYYDPLRYTEPYEIAFLKHFRYHYQNELRFLVRKKDGSGIGSEHFELSLGPMSDICDLVVI